MKWQLIKNGEPSGEHYDDGLPHAAGCDGFTTELVEAEATRLNADGFNYIGQSDVVETAPVEEAQGE